MRRVTAMNCDHCNQPATVHFMQIAQGEMTKAHLCADCAEERGVTDPASFSLSELLSQEIAQQSEAANEERSGGDHRCPACGFSLADLRKTQRLGCSRCYEEFRGELEPMVQNLHDASRHGGKLPGGLVDRVRLQTQLDELRQRLQQAVSGENYEEAARCRDQISELETEIERVD